MKRLRIPLVLVAVLLAFGIFYGVLAKSGEVVVLETQDAAGAVHQSRIWVVDDAGFAWLRTGEATAPWLARLRARNFTSSAYPPDSAILGDDSSKRCAAAGRAGRTPPRDGSHDLQGTYGPVVARTSPVHPFELRLSPAPARARPSAWLLDGSADSAG